MDCGQTRGLVTPGFGFGGLPSCGYAGAVGFSIGFGRCPSRQIVADFPLPRVPGLELGIQGAAKASATHSAREPRGPSKVAPPRTALPIAQTIFAGWGLETFARRTVEMDRKKILSAHFVFPLLNTLRGWRSRRPLPLIWMRLGGIGDHAVSPDFSVARLLIFVLFWIGAHAVRPYIPLWGWRSRRPGFPL